MVTTDPITDQPEKVSCPHCEQPLLEVSSHRVTSCSEFPFYAESDTLRLGHRLSRQQQRGGCMAIGMTGICPLCHELIAGVRVVIMDQPVGEEIEDAYFYQNGVTVRPTNFLAWSGALSWTVSRYDTPQGPLLEHMFGPDTFSFAKWQCALGRDVLSDDEDSPFDLAAMLVLELWDDLRAVPTALGLAPDDPRARTRRARRPSARAEPVVELCVPAATGLPSIRPPGPGDDDIPF